MPQPMDWDFQHRFLGDLEEAAVDVHRCDDISAVEVVLSGAGAAPLTNFVLAPGEALKLGIALYSMAYDLLEETGGGPVWLTPRPNIDGDDFFWS
jgi:hypothetical protein